jgi:hypothetical protein
MQAERCVGRVVVLGLAAALVFVPRGHSDDAPAAAPAPASALQAALESNLKLARGWLDEADFISAAQAAQGLEVLAWLYAHHGGEARWRERTTALRQACAGLAVAARRKDAADCDRAARACADLLAELAKAPPGGARPVGKDFRPPGATKTWMLLMEGAYADGKTARTPGQLARYAHEIAEEANAVSFLRSDPRWRKMAQDVRASALEAAEAARGKDVGKARKALKSVSARCEACHETRPR